MLLQTSATYQISLSHNKGLCKIGTIWFVPERQKMKNLLKHEWLNRYCGQMATVIDSFSPRNFSAEEDDEI